MSGDNAEQRRIRETYVLPFYMRVTTQGPMLAGSIAAVGRSAPVHDILRMLESPWRQRKVGAWFSLVRSEDAVISAVLQSLRTSVGFLTSPDLAMAAVNLAGRDALPALRDYEAADIQNKWGGANLIAAALEFLGESSANGPATAESTFRFSDLMVTAGLVAASDTTIRSRALGTIAMPPIAEGQAIVELPSGTRSLVLVPAAGEPWVGCKMSRRDGNPLRMGDRDVDVELEFWDEGAPGTALWRSVRAAIRASLGRGKLARPNPALNARRLFSQIRHTDAPEFRFRSVI